MQKNGCDAENPYEAARKDHFSSGSPEDAELAADHYVRAIELGSGEALNALAGLILRNRDVFKSNPEKRMNIILKAAENGHVYAQRHAAGIHILSNENKDVEASKYWLRRAAAQGDLLSEYILSEMEEVEALRKFVSENHSIRNEQA